MTRARVMFGLVLNLACGGGNGESQIDLMDFVITDEVLGNVEVLEVDSAPDAPVFVSRDVVKDRGASGDVSRDILRDTPQDVGDVLRDGIVVVRDVPYVHRDTGGDFPSRDARKE